MAFTTISSWQIDGKTLETVRDFFFPWAPKSLWSVTVAMKLKILAPWKKSNDKPRQCIKKQRYYFASKGPSSQSCGFSSSHVWMLELDNKKGWAPKNWYLWTVVLEKTREFPWTARRSSQSIPKGNQHWIFIWRTKPEAEPPILCPPDVKSWLFAKTLDSGKD